jgi:hypothetical protein
VDHKVLKLELDGQERQIMVVNVTADTQIESLADHLYAEHPQLMTYIDVIVARFFCQDFPTGCAPTSETLKPLIDRAPKASIYGLSANDYQIQITANLNEFALYEVPTWSLTTPFIDALRDAEMRDYIASSSALFGATDKYVYRSPSHQYCTTFVRVGNIQMGRFQLDAIFFWLLPYLKGTNAIITDTWSISSIALNSARLLQHYDPTRTEVPEVQMLSHYYDGSPDMRRDTQQLLNEATRNGRRRALCVISTFMTGKSLEHLRSAVQEAGIPDDMIGYIALYRLGSDIQTDILGLCDLSGGIGSTKFESFSSPPPGRVVVEIDPRTYFPLHLEETVIGISAGPICGEVTRFFNNYQGCGAVGMHRNSLDINGQRIRHHGIYIDVLKMLEVESFKEKLRGALNEIDPPPALMVAPPHEAGVALLEFAGRFFQEKFKVTPRQLTHPDLDKNDPAVPSGFIRSLTDDDTLLILDDVTTTGMRLSRFQQHLRDAEIAFKGRIFYLIGVARPAAEHIWERRQRDLRYRAAFRRQSDRQHRVIAIEKLVLPDWTERDCPWCQEEDGINAALELIPRRSDEALEVMLRTRLRRLINARNGPGLIDDAIWRINAAPAPRMTDNSIFIRNDAPSDADVLTAVGAVLHHMRVELPLGCKYPHVTVIDHQDYLGTTFNDVILKLAILRACKKEELVHWKDDRELARRALASPLLLGEGVDGSDRDPLRLEFGIAMLAGKLPHVIVDHSELEALEDSLTWRFLSLLHRLRH